MAAIRAQASRRRQYSSLSQFLYKFPPPPLQSSTNQIKLRNRSPSGANSAQSITGSMSYRSKSKPKAASSDNGYSEKQLREIFKQMDTNEDGGLGLFEIKNALTRLDAEFPVHLAFKALCYADRDRDGKLGVDEIDKFVKYMMSQGYVV